MEMRDVIIIGGGPAGLSAAHRLHELGVKDVLVIEREAEAGGIPRHCGHTGFGWDSHWRLLTGPRFADLLRKAASPVEIRTRTTVLELAREGRIRVQTPMGVREIQGRQILLATGTRETPRSALLVGGSRPLKGVMNTGALQQHVYLYGNKPFESPVIVGSELVSFSSLMTCRHMGIRPVMMIEAKDHTIAPSAGRIIARFGFGVPVRLSTSIVSIEGRDKVEAVTVRDARGDTRVDCDGVVFSGHFHPERALVPKGSFLENLGPDDIDCYAAAGNVNGPEKTSGKCWIEGRKAADRIKARLT